MSDFDQLEKQLKLVNKKLERIQNNVIFWFWFLVGWWLVLIGITIIFAPLAAFFNNN